MSAGVEVTFTGGRWHGQTREIPDGLDALILPSANGKMNETYRIEGDTATLESVTERVFPLKVGDRADERALSRLPLKSVLLDTFGNAVQRRRQGWFAAGHNAPLTPAELVALDSTILHIAKPEPTP